MTYDLVLERTLERPARPRLAGAGPSPSMLKRWFAPRPYEISEVEIDLRPGGIFRMRMVGPDGFDTGHGNAGCVLEVVEGEKLVWTSALGPGYRPAEMGEGCESFPMTAVDHAGRCRRRQDALPRGRAAPERGRPRHARADGLPGRLGHLRRPARGACRGAGAMRRLVVGMMVSLDGVMQAPGGPEEDPTGGFALRRLGLSASGTRSADAAMGESFARPFDLLLGRKTYEIFAAHWPYQEGEIADPFNAATKYVATSSAEPLAWRNSVRLEGDVTDAVARLKQGDGPDLLTQGSATLVRSLLAAGLVDELFLLVFPVLLGKGKTLVRRGCEARRMDPGRQPHLDDRRDHRRYRPKGPVRTGSFAGAGAERGRAGAAREDERRRAEMADDRGRRTADRRAARGRVRRLARSRLRPAAGCSRPPDGVMERCEIDARSAAASHRGAARRRPCRALWRICRDRPAAPPRLRFLDQLQRGADADHGRDRARAATDRASP